MATRDLGRWPSGTRTDEWRAISWLCGDYGADEACAWVSAREDGEKPLRGLLSALALRGGASALDVAAEYVAGEDPDAGAFYVLIGIPVAHELRRWCHERLVSESFVDARERLALLRAEVLGACAALLPVSTDSALLLVDRDTAIDVALRIVRREDPAFADLRLTRHMSAPGRAARGVMGGSL